MGEPNNSHFYDFGIFEPVITPQNQLFVSLETPGHLNKIKNNPQTVLRILLFINIKNPELFLTIFEKAGTENDEDPFNI